MPEFTPEQVETIEYSAARELIHALNYADRNGVYIGSYTDGNGFRRYTAFTPGGRSFDIGYMRAHKAYRWDVSHEVKDGE